MERLIFPKDFLFGCATASYQVEGATREDGRKDCIWDTYAYTPGKVHAGDDGKVSCDQYHRYKEDVQIMSDLGIQAYRFSIAWPRIIPDGIGKVNPKGVEYYRNLCNELHSKGIKACATIYHWDLPQSLEDKGGWTNRETAFALAEYAKVCFEELGDVVDEWYTINEPFCITFLGYLYGNQAPGRTDKNDWIKAVHHINLAHGLAVQKYRETKLTAPIGIVLNPITPRPATRKMEDLKAVEYRMAIQTEIFAEPIFKGTYPKLAVDHLRDNYGLELPIQEGDMEIISLKTDKVGINYYSENPIVWNDDDFTRCKNAPTWEKTTNMGWTVDSDGLLRQIMWLHEYTNGLPIFVAENGSCEDDKLTLDGRVHDTDRIQYLYKHLNACSEAIKRGANLQGYFVWSFIDNFEWGFGFAKRFGIIYCDYQTLKRYPKDSAYFYRDVIAGYGEI